MPLLPRMKNFKSPMNVPNSVKAVINDVSKVAKFMERREEYEQLDDETHEKSDSSFRMNDPAVKEDFKKFLKELSQSSAGSKCSQQCLTPLDEILSWSSSIPEQKERNKNKKVSKSTDNIENEKFDFMKNFKNTQKKPKKNISNPLITQGDNNGKSKNKEVNGVCKDISHVEKTEKAAKNKISSNASKNTQKEMSIYERMKKIQESRNIGLYVLCDRCDKARYYFDFISHPLFVSYNYRTLAQN